MDKKKKILYVFCSRNYSGAEIVIERLILNNSRIDPWVLCPQGEFAERLLAKGIPVFPENALLSLNRNKNNYSNVKLLFYVIFKYVKITYRVIFLLFRHKFDIIHSNNFSASTYLIPSILISKLIFLDKKWIWSNHDLVYPQGNQSEKLAKLCTYFFDLTLAVSNAVKNKYPQYQRKIKVLYNGLDINQFKNNELKRENFRNEIAISKNIILIGIIGLIIERKGHHLLIRAYKELLKRHNNIFLVIVGNFLPAEYEYKKMITETLNSIPQGKWLFLPFKEDVVPIYCALDILVNASTPEKSEPLGTSIYEAMSCQKIVIASKTGGSPEIISNGIDGFLFEAGDVNDLVLKLDHVIRKVKSMDNIRLNARNKVIHQFNISKMVKNYNKFIKE